MGSHGDDLEPDNDWFPSTRRRPEDYAEDARKAWENRPFAVLGEIALILAATVMFVTFLRVLLYYLHIR